MHDRDDKDDVLQEPVGVKVPVGDDPSAEETTHRASRGKGDHLGQFPAFEFLLDKKVLASGWLLSNWPLLFEGILFSISTLSLSLGGQRNCQN